MSYHGLHLWSVMSSLHISMMELGREEVFELQLVTVYCLLGSRNAISFLSPMKHNINRRKWLTEEQGQEQRAAKSGDRELTGAVNWRKVRRQPCDNRIGHDISLYTFSTDFRSLRKGICLFVVAIRGIHGLLKLNCVLGRLLLLRLCDGIIRARYSGS